MTLDLVAFNDALKHLYTNQRLEMMAYKRNPFLAMVTKMEAFLGLDMPIPIVYANPQGRSATFATAQTKSLTTSSGIKAFQLKRVKDYGVAVIDNETMEASEGNAGAFMAARKNEIDGILLQTTRSLATAMYRGGYGKVGVAGTISGSTITLNPIDDVTNFEVGQDIQLAATESTSLLRAGGPITITNIDRTAGVLTFSAGVVATIATAVSGDVLFVNGDRQNSATPSMTKVAGLEAWIPTATPSSTAFFGVDRSVDTRLGGLRLARTGYNLEEALVDGVVLAAREGAMPDKVLTNFSTYGSLEKLLGSKVQYIDLKVSPTIAFPGVRVSAPSGVVDVVADQNCPNNRFYILELDSWKLCSLKKAPRIIGSDGLEMIRQSTADGVEIRCGYYANLACDAPGYNVNVQV